MKHLWLVTLIFGATITRRAEAQVMATSGPIPLDAVGLPPQAPVLTLVGMASPGELATDPSLLPKGELSEVVYQELRAVASPAGAAGEVEASVRTKFDEQGRITERIESRWNRETDTVYSYKDGRLVSEETNSQGRKKAWNYWTYNSRGLLSDYRRGQGSELQNHELGFQYDDKGRLLGFEYRQGPDDAPFSRTKIAYSSDGNTIEITKLFIGTNIIDHSTNTLDKSGRVVHVVLHSEGRAVSREASDIRLRYDEKGRLVEQTTNATEFSDFDAENDLPPGTISIEYDDAAHTKTTRYSSPAEGSMRSVVTQDANQRTVAYSLTAGSVRQSWKLECQSDRQGNWTSCAQTVELGGQESIKGRFRRTVIYR